VSNDDRLFAGFDALVEHTRKEIPTHLPRMAEEAARRASQSTTKQLVAELRAPSSNLVFARDAVRNEALARILINTDL
jgi:hypothetical protein